MKWFSVFSYRTYFYRSIAALIVGVIMLFVPNDTLHTLVMLIGAFILLAGIGTAISAYRSNHNLFLSLGGVAALVSVVLGIVLISRPDVFVNMVVVLFGILLLFVGLLQIINVANMRRDINHPRFYIAGGLLPLIVGLVFLLFPQKIISFIGVLLGITLILYALNELGLGFRIQKHFKNVKTEAEDVDFVEVENS